MSEAIIARGGRSSKGGLDEFKVSVGKRLVTEYIYNNSNWVVPSDAYQNIFSIRIFGGGGGGKYVSYNNWTQCSPAGGGGGWMNNSELVLNPGEIINISIGSGGSELQSGGSTFFGNYLSANGGSPATPNSLNAYIYDGGSGGAGGGSTQGKGGDGYQFGGGGGKVGGNGGIWGGGGGGAGNNGIGGNGGMYGGGGGGYKKGGNGGMYGGGGGSRFTNAIGIGGTYGGNGGNYSQAAENGINTSTWTNVFHDGNNYFRGNGARGLWGCCGGGGYGGNGGYGGGANAFFSGGGGYGGNGGSSSYDNGVNISITAGNLGGGGGGYGGNGGCISFSSLYISEGGTGGGGYGCNGGRVSTNGTGSPSYPFCSSGGGGYYSTANPASDDRIYSDDGSYYYNMGLSASGGGGFLSFAKGGCTRKSTVSGQNGICIIQYYRLGFEFKDNNSI